MARYTQPHDNRPGLGRMSEVCLKGMAMLEIVSNERLNIFLLDKSFSLNMIH